MQPDDIVSLLCFANFLSEYIPRIVEYGDVLRKYTGKDALPFAQYWEDEDAKDEEAEGSATKAVSSNNRTSRTASWSACKTN